MTVRVVGAAEAAARDAAAIGGGTPSADLMRRAGEVAADTIARNFADRLAGGVAIFAGPGNNGGDAWVVARALTQRGVAVGVAATGDARSADARAARAAALAQFGGHAPTIRGDEGVIVDGLLGTGTSGAPRGAIAEAVAAIAAQRARGAAVVSLDLPSGLDATTGAAEGAVRADATLTFATMKRGLLVARGLAGAIAVLDIGLGPHADLADGAPVLVDAPWVARHVPPIAAESHKGTRRRIAIIGGAEGMAGAAVLAARGAMRSGAGMVRIFAAPPSLSVVQIAVTEATAARWPESDDELAGPVAQWAHAVLLGPGLGQSAGARALAERVLRGWRGPVVVDADGLNVFDRDPRTLGELLGGRPAVVTPHVNECARLVKRSPDEVLAARFEVGAELAASLGAVVLLKGVPTVLSDPSGTRLVSAAGTPVLAAAGSGDVLGGIVTTLLAQIGDPLAAAACAAWIHGRAGEIAGAGRPVRGVTLDDVLAGLGYAWAIDARPPEPPVLGELPRTGDLV